jgi:hypothetical protein
MARAQQQVNLLLFNRKKCGQIKEWGKTENCFFNFYDYKRHDGWRMMEHFPPLFERDPHSVVFGIHSAFRHLKLCLINVLRDLWHFAFFDEAARIKDKFMVRLKLIENGLFL